MYTTLILLGIIVFPIPSLVQCIRRGLNPYNGVLNATVSVGLGSLLIFIFASVAGSSVATELEASYEAAMPMLLQSFPDQEEALRLTIDIAISGFPSTVLLMGAVAAYLEYLILSKFIRNGDRGPGRWPDSENFPGPEMEFMAGC